MAPAAASEPNAAPAAGHPRVYFTAESLERLRGQAATPTIAPLLAQMRERAAAALAEPMPTVVLPDDLLLPGEPTWDQRYPRDEETFATHERMMYPLRALYGTHQFHGVVPSVALLRQLGDDFVPLWDVANIAQGREGVEERFAKLVGLYEQEARAITPWDGGWGPARRMQTGPHPM